MKQKKRALDSQIYRAKENLKLAKVGPATDKHEAPTHQLKIYLRAVIEWPTVVQLKRKKQL